jgi:hypothetical protein
MASAPTAGTNPQPRHLGRIPNGALSDQFLAERTTALFLIALGERNYLKACAQMAERRGCIARFAKKRAGLTSFGLLGALASMDRAVAVAFADGVQIRLFLVRRGGRWLIEDSEPSGDGATDRLLAR